VEFSSKAQRRRFVEQACAGDTVVENHIRAGLASPSYKNAPTARFSKGAILV
jgi:hypothetical protein